MSFARFMAGPVGRGLRVLVGAVLLVLAFTVLTGVATWVAAVVGLVFVLVGLLNICGLAPLFGAPLSGKALLRQTAR